MMSMPGFLPKPAIGTRPHRQRPLSLGFSLIELMIAITVSMFLILGLATILFSVRSTFSTQDHLTQLQENQRFLISVLSNSIHDAGYFTTPLVDNAKTALPASTATNADGTSFAAGQSLAGATGSGTASDTLNTRFQTTSGDSLMNCEGMTNTSGAPLVYVNSFAVNSSKQLTCNGSVLLDNVTSMKILYGVDSDGDSSVDMYLTPEAVTLKNYWQAVGSVQITITFENLIDPKSGAPALPTLVHTVSLMNRA